MKLLIYILFVITLSFCASSETKDSTSPKKEGSSSPSRPPSPSPSGAESEAKPSPKPDKKKASEEDDEKSSLDKGSSESYSKPSSIEKKSESGLKAGFADDNKQFNYFLGFLNKFSKNARHIPIDVSERILINVFSSNEKTISGALVEIFGDGIELEKGQTYSNGTYLFFPSEYSGKKNFTVKVTAQNKSKTVNFARNSTRKLNIVLGADSKQDTTPMDIVFIMDTTGSMGGEIARLKATIEIIHLNLSQAKTKIRFGMVLYKDKNDEYVTEVIPLTEDLKKFQQSLEVVSAAGGGDLPEDLEAGIQDAVEKIKWKEDAVKLGFIITDAPPHLDYKRDFNYVSTIKNAKKKGIKFFSVGTGGLDINGEYVLRQIAQYTYGKYIFLTYGEKSESDGGKPGSVSHHTGDNFSTDKLESIIIQFAREEFANANHKPIEKGEEYFTASKISTEKKEETLRKLFDKSISQLNDYSTLKIPKGTSLAILPIRNLDKKYARTAEYFGEQLLISVSKSDYYKLIERKDFQKILEEWKRIQQTGSEEEANVKIGKISGAKILLLSDMYNKENSYEIFIKMVNTETGEILAVNKLLLENELGL
ncbi:MAG: VWA domain-containing protein [Leptospiraceae bacterium]|nr:VWA domain-containing protein [Leptospiraceae bacterium]